MSIHINRPSSTKFVAMVRGYGCRRWIKAGPVRKSVKRAAHDMVRRFYSSANLKRGCVLMTADYYDPISVLDMVKP